VTRLRLGIIGCGRVVEVFHLSVLRTCGRWSVRALADPKEERLAALGQMAPDASHWTDLEAMIRSVPLDAVLIAAPPEEHVRGVVAALEAGLSVLLEKPGGRSVDEAENMVAALGDQVAWVAFNRRFMPPYGRLKAWIHSEMSSESLRGQFDLGFSVAGWRSVSDYLGDVTRGGSVRLDVASHQLDLLPWLFESDLARISVQAWDDRSGAEGTIDYRVELVTGAEIRCLAAHRPGYTERLQIHSRAGSCLAQPTGVLIAGRDTFPSIERRARIDQWLKRKLVRLGMASDLLAASYALQWEAFADQIQGKMPPTVGTPLIDLPRLHRRLAALERSADKGEPEAIPPVS